MSKFTKTFKDTLEFDKDKIEVKMERLKRGDMKRLAPHISEEGVMSFAESMEMMDVAADILPNYIKSFGGLMVEGREITEDSQFFKEEFFEESYFSPLIGAMLGSLMKNSFIEQHEEKKLESTSEETMADSLHPHPKPLESVESP